MEFKPHDYQTYLIDRITDSDERGVGVMLDMGMGKTAIALTAVKKLIDAGKAKHVLVLAPARVAECVWRQEAAKWDHLQGLTVSLLAGTRGKRERQLQDLPDVTVMSRDLIAWLVDFTWMYWEFDTLVVDELSGFKAAGTVRFKKLKKVLPGFRRVIGLTGTPMPRDVGDLWSQIYLLDQGARLGRTLTEFRKRYMTQNFYTHQWTELPGAREAVQALIGDICVAMRACDYLTLPPLITNDIQVTIDGAARDFYELYKRRYVAEFAGKRFDAANAAVLGGKLLQVCNGAVYHDEQEAAGGYEIIHSAKLDALMDALEGLEGLSALVYYQYTHDKRRIMDAVRDRFPGMRVALISDNEAVERWNRRELDVLLAHPASAGYGLNLQEGGRHIVWYGLPWSLEHYQQAAARLWRQGQTGPVVAHRLLVSGGMDERVASVLERKGAGQEALLDALRAYANEVAHA